MTSKVLSFASRVSDQPGWTNAELAELYRVEHALVQAHISIETDHGVTDEGDPWFIFCRTGGEVVIHATRFGGLYRLYSPALPQPLTGASFSALTRSFVSGLRNPIKAQADASVTIHPAALLSVMIAAIFYSIDFHSVPAQAAQGAREHEKKDAESTHLLSEPASADTLFQTFVTSIKALLEPGAGAASHPFAFLAAIEATAVAAAAIALSGLADFGTGSTSELMTKTVADDQQCVLDCQIGVSPHAQRNEKGNWESASDAINLAAITAFLQGDPQSGEGAKHILPIAAEHNDDMVAGDGKTITLSVNSNTAPTADSRGNTDISGTLTDRSQDPNPGHGALALNPSEAFQLQPISPGPDSTAAAPPPNSTGAGGGSHVLPASVPISTDAYFMVASDTSSGSFFSPTVLSTIHLPLDGAIEQALSHAGYTVSSTLAALAPSPAQLGPLALPVAPIAPPTSSAPDLIQSVSSILGAPLVLGSSVGVNPTPQSAHDFDSAANASLLAFVHATPHFEVDVVGENVIVIDTNVSHMTNSDFGVQSWNLADGSMLTIVGIIPHSAHAIG